MNKSLERNYMNMLDNRVIDIIKENADKIKESFPFYYSLIENNDIFNYFFIMNYNIGNSVKSNGIYIYDKNDRFYIHETNRFPWAEEDKAFHCLDDLYYYLLISMVSDIASCYGIRYRKKYGDARIGCQIVSFEIMNIFENYKKRFKDDAFQWMEEQRNVDWTPVYEYINKLNY